MACFQHKRTAALSAAVISLLTFQWISAVLLLIGYDKQKNLDEKYGETWVCDKCGTKETLTRFLYPGMCVSCAKVAKRDATRILKEAKECVSLSDNLGDIEKEAVQNCLNEVEYIRDNRDKFPMLKRSLRNDIENLLNILIKIDAENQVEYRDKLSKNSQLDEEYNINNDTRLDVERNNKTMSRIAIGVVTALSFVIIGYAVFLGTQLSIIQDSINDINGILGSFYQFL